jgi:hypothetical protein
MMRPFVIDNMGSIPYKESALEASTIRKNGFGCRSLDVNWSTISSNTCKSMMLLLKKNIAMKLIGKYVM